MKNTFIALGLVAGLAVHAHDTNTVETVELNGKNTPWSIELTLGGGGTTTVSGDSSFGMDFSVGTNPFANCTDIWIGVVQGLYWEPSFAGSTDLYADYSFHLWNETLYLNVGWSGGAVYDTVSMFWRTGPEASFQYYITDETFIYVGANYDFNFNDEVDDGIRYGFGLGVQF